MIEISFQQSAPDGSVFAPGCFETSIGQEIPFRMEGAILQATVVSAVVNGDGHWALITVQLPVTFPALLDGISVVSQDNES